MSYRTFNFKEAEFAILLLFVFCLVEQILSLPVCHKGILPELYIEILDFAFLEFGYLIFLKFVCGILWGNLLLSFFLSIWIIKNQAQFIKYYICNVLIYNAISVIKLSVKSVTNSYRCLGCFWTVYSILSIHLSFYLYQNDII